MSPDSAASRRKPRKPAIAPTAAGGGDVTHAAHATTPPALPPLIVGIGASAGGLEAYKSFFASMAANRAMADCQMAFVLVQHLAPHHTSLLAELVGRSTTMEVVEATDGEHVQPGHVYVIPPNATLTIADRGSRTTPRGCTWSGASTAGRWSRRRCAAALARA